MKNIDWYRQGYIPTLLYFQNGGTFTGSVTDSDDRSKKEFRYKIETDDGSIRALVWFGPFCFEKSEVVDQHEFTLDDEGRAGMIEWLKTKYETMIE